MQLAAVKFDKERLLSCCKRCTSLAGTVWRTEPCMKFCWRHLGDTDVRHEKDPCGLPCRFEDALPELRDLVGGPSRWGSRPLLLW